MDLSGYAGRDVDEFNIIEEEFGPTVGYVPHVENDLGRSAPFRCGVGGRRSEMLGVINRVPIGHGSIDGAGGVWVANEHLLTTIGAGRGANPLDPAVKDDIAARMSRSVPRSRVILAANASRRARAGHVAHRGC